MRRFSILVVATAALTLTPAAAAAPPGIAIRGLTPDEWGTTVAEGRADLSSSYRGIHRVSCLGARMPEYPLAESTWVDEGDRYWDKLWCSGTIRNGQAFRLIWDLKSETRYALYRLIGVTRAQLARGGAQPQPPTREWDKILLARAYETALGRGRDSGGSTTARVYRYSVDGCQMVSGASARCTLWLYNEQSVTDANFRPGLLRFILRLYVFANLIDVETGAWVSRIEGGYFDMPFDIVCSDRNTPGSSIIVDWTRAGQVAPRCTS